MSIHHVLDFKIPPEHEALFASLTRLCDEHRLLNQLEGRETRDLSDGVSDPSTLLRFLAARRFDPDAALDQLKETYQFRQEKSTLKLYDIIPISDFEQARQFVSGNPLLLMKPHLHDSGSSLNRSQRQEWSADMHLPILIKMVQHARRRLAKPLAGNIHIRCTTSSSSGYVTVGLDRLTCFFLPLCSMMKDRPDSSVPITNSVYLVDASYLGLEQGWSVRTFAQQISWLLSTRYPKTIQRIIVCNAPSYFIKIWKYLRGWVDPYTAEKIVVLTGAEVLPTLMGFIGDEIIHSIFGGGFSYKHGMLPGLDSSIRTRLNWGNPEKSLPPGPIKWTREADSKILASAVGSQSGSARYD
ncbi:unnamed protein product, partial [Penicillium nalgiovense]